jgi:hypothetical protein
MSCTSQLCERAPTEWVCIYLSLSQRAAQSETAAFIQATMMASAKTPPLDCVLGRLFKEARRRFGTSAIDIYRNRSSCCCAPMAPASGIESMRLKWLSFLPSAEGSGMFDLLSILRRFDARWHFYWQLFWQEPNLWRTLKIVFFLYAMGIDANKENARGQIAVSKARFPALHSLGTAFLVWFWILICLGT